MLNRLKKSLEYFGAVLLIALLLTAIGGVIVVKFYGDDVSRYALEEINSRLDTRISVNKVSVSFFQRFPYISIVMDDVTAWSGKGFAHYDFPYTNTDTLFHASALYFQFNPLSLIRHRYKIGKIEAVSGFLHLYTDLNGRGNYHFLKEGDNEDEGSPLFLDLKKVELKAFRVSYMSIPGKTDIDAFVDYLHFNGKFADRDYQLLMQTRMHVGHVRSASTTYITGRELKLKVGMAVSDSLYRISTANVQLDDLAVDASGNFVVHRSGGLTLDITQSSEHIELGDVLPLLPSSFSERYRDMVVRGTVGLHSSVSGYLAPGSFPDFDAAITVNNGYIKVPGAPFPVEKLKLEGRVGNRNLVANENFRADISSLEFESAGDQVKGQFTYIDARKKEFYGNLSGALRAENLPSWYPGLPVESCSGPVTFDLGISGIMSGSNNQPGELYLKGDATLDGVNLGFSWYALPFNDLTGKLEIDGNVLGADLAGICGNSDFHFTGDLINLPAYLLSDTETLNLRGELGGRALHVDQLIDSYQSNGDPNDTTVRLPGMLSAKLYFEADSLYYRGIAASTVSGSARYYSRYLAIDHFTLNSMNGVVSGRTSLIQMQDSSFRFDLSASFDHIDIQNLFLSFDNFGQEFITDQHLKGTISGNGILTSPLTSGFTMQTGQLKCESSVVINNGELLNFEPLSALSSFIDVEELRDIRFSRLENTILIDNSQVIIPQMKVTNSAINLTASGEHSFDNLYEYRIRLKLSDLLYNKARKEEVDGYEPEANDGDERTLFLKIYDRGPGMKVEYDRKQAAEKIRSDLKNERTELKILFNEEFGMFRKDSAVQQNTQMKEGNQPLFRFEFEDEAAQDSLKNQTNKPFSRKNKRRTEEQETKRDFKIVIDENER